VGGGRATLTLHWRLGMRGRRGAARSSSALTLLIPTRVDFPNQGPIFLRLLAFSRARRPCRRKPRSQRRGECAPSIDESAPTFEERAASTRKRLVASCRRPCTARRTWPPRRIDVIARRRKWCSRHGQRAQRRLEPCPRRHKRCHRPEKPCRPASRPLASSSYVPPSSYEGHHFSRESLVLVDATRATTQGALRMTTRPRFPRGSTLSVGFPSHRAGLASTSHARRTRSHDRRRPCFDEGSTRDQASSRPQGQPNAASPWWSLVAAPSFLTLRLAREGGVRGF
jgi:hypothetical protein